MSHKWCLHILYVFFPIICTCTVCLYGPMNDFLVLLFFFLCQCSYLPQTLCLPWQRVSWVPWQRRTASLQLKQTDPQVGGVHQHEAICGETRHLQVLACVLGMGWGGGWGWRDGWVCLGGSLDHLHTNVRFEVDGKPLLTVPVNSLCTCHNIT